MKYRFLLLTVLASIFTACNYNAIISSLEKDIHDLKNRVEEISSKLNNNIASLQVIIDAHAKDDYIVSVTPVTENGKEIGYVISFARSGDITIYHGKDSDVIIPFIGVMQWSDGQWYWAIDGEFLLDSKGNKVQASSHDGKDGKDGTTPQFKIENDYWYVSYDEGKTWQELGRATGLPGKDGNNNSVFSDISVSDNCIVFTLTDGTSFSIPMKPVEPEIIFQIEDLPAIAAGQMLDIKYTIKGGDSKTYIDCVCDSGWTSEIKNNSTSGGIIRVTAPNPFKDGKIIVFVNTGDGRSFMKTLVFEKGIVSVSSQHYEVGSEGGLLRIALRSNIYYFVDTDSLPEWISMSPSTKVEERVDTVEFYISPNVYTSSRKGTVRLVDKDGIKLDAFIVTQNGDNFGIIDFVDDNVRKICLANFDINSDGFLSVDEAAAVESLNESFKDHGEITSFEEFQYFVGLNSIEDEAFYGCRRLENVILPKSITYIGKSAFFYTNLSSIIIPSNVEEIGDKAFEQCSNLVSVKFADNFLRVIGNDAFNGARITSIDLPDSVEEIGKRAFRGTSLVSFRLPPHVDIISEACFEACYQLKDVYIHDFLSRICARAFAGAGFNNIYLPESLTTIEQSAFQETRLHSVKWPVSVNTIPGSAFQSCYELVDIQIPEGVESIKESAFFGCTAIDRISVPNTVLELGRSVFEACKSLKEVDLSESLDNIPTYTFSRCSSLLRVVVPSKVTSIGSYAFDACTSLVSVILPENLKNLGSYAFDSCSSIDELVFPDQVRIIPYNCCNNCVKLRKVTMGENVTSIEGCAFRGCKSLNSIEIPNSVTAIDSYTFSGCESLESIAFPLGITEIPSSICSSCYRLQNIILGENTDEIGQQAFEMCTSLRTINIPSKVSQIGSNAFRGCSSLLSIFLPDALNTLSAGAFRDCSSLAEVTLGTNLESIYDYAFSRCMSLKLIHLPQGLKSISNNVFEFCENLTSVVVPNTVEDIGSESFRGCKSLESIVFEVEGNLTKIGSKCFSDCVVLRELSIPHKVLTIPSSLCQGCTSLVTIRTADKIEKIEANALENCSSLSRLFLGATTPPDVYAIEYFKKLSDSFRIVVPVDALSSYQTALGWSEVSSILIPDA